jgi:DNA replication protein DnaC
LLLKQLKLARFRSHWQPLAEQAEAQGWSPGQFLYALCELELEQRQIARQQRLLRGAHLPWQKGLDGFDHQHLDPRQWQELKGLTQQTTWLLQADVRRQRKLVRRFASLIVTSNWCRDRIARFLCLRILSG